MISLLPTRTQPSLPLHTHRKPHPIPNAESLTLSRSRLGFILQSPPPIIPIPLPDWIPLPAQHIPTLRRPLHLAVRAPDLTQPLNSMTTPHAGHGVRCISLELDVAVLPHKLQTESFHIGHRTASPPQHAAEVRPGAR